MKNSVKYPFEVQYIDLPNNTRIAYMDEGEGEQTILFVHGLANYAPVWKKNIDYLKQHFRCIALDLPGNGLSDRNNHQFSMAFFAQTIQHFIVEAKLKRVCLAGHSMGAQIAMTALLANPTCAEKLLLFAPAGLESFTALDKTMYYTTLHFLDYLSSEENSLRRTMENSFYKLPPQANDMINELSRLLQKDNLRYYRAMIDTCIKSMLEDEVYTSLEKISVPTLVFFGTEDALIPNKLIHHITIKKMATDAIKRMPNAELTLIEHCGHFVHWEKAEEVNLSVVKFLTT